MGKNNLTKQTILSKTSYGLNIYAHILRQFFPEDEVLIKVLEGTAAFVAIPSITAKGL